jgi:hypothetical protein
MPQWKKEGLPTPFLVKEAQEQSQASCAFSFLPV